MLGRVYLAQRKLDAALGEFDDLARRNPTNVNYRTIGALIAHTQQNVAEAKKRYEEIVGLDPTAAVASNDLALGLDEHVQRGAQRRLVTPSVG